MANMYTNMATNAMCAVLSTGIKLQNPATSKVHAMFGNVNRRSDRRPNVSIVHTAGQAKRKLINPNPQEARRDCFASKPAEEKIVEL